MAGTPSCCHGNNVSPPHTTGYVCPLQFKCVSACSNELDACGGGGNLRFKVPKVVTAHLGVGGGEVTHPHTSGHVTSCDTQDSYHNPAQSHLECILYNSLNMDRHKMYTI